jgi:hypothetical protein
VALAPRQDSWRYRRHNKADVPPERSLWVGVMTMLFDGAVESLLEAGTLRGSAVSGIQQSARLRGVASLEEAEFLFAMDRCGLIGGAEWFALAVRSVADFLVWDTRPTGHVTESEADWLMGVIGDQPSAFGRAVLFAVVRNAESSPARLGEMVIRAGVSRSLLV